ncbi:alpha/beta hydrolase [Cohnella sp. CIP 111063]|jgi:pimeloyl-ACP methyl ester carboxylesterase|uniref:alpha/beta fold hydrolase n=1 Tax=unclassified Cohnella TaxID=2636738 RepID=UPI000B8BCFE7|nr:MULTISPECIES: alpha/beta hydrolase [unclassified Cohnella]OXS56513.1 alpha/beta hydrolase [Cohnella sp. CIP 111063]PRX68691.1 pimeloyl-ACP methyl ester carboxylesterase [Cohnella sp. SGD-V74]
MRKNTQYHTATLEGLDIFYREAGEPGSPVVLLLHGFPTSSHMYRQLIPALADRYHVIAPDYPGFGYSSAPDHDKFEYSFDRFSQIIEQLLEQLNITKFFVYLMDYGAPVGFRIAARHPERIQGLIIQNGNAYDEGLKDFWDPIKAYWKDRSNPDKREALRWLTSFQATQWQYTHGVKDSTLISPDTYTLDQSLLDRPGNQEIQLDMFLDYGTNPPLYPAWQQYFREAQPPTLILWGKGDEIFPESGAHPYLNDLPNAEIHIFEDAGHFALESHGSELIAYIREFLNQNK